MKKRIGWGTGIAISLIAFIAFIIILVVSSTNNTSDYLQDNDYYEKGLKHQDHIELVANTLPFKDEIRIEVIATHPNVMLLKIQLPKQMKLGEVKLHLYRPSDGNLDERKIVTSLFDSNNEASYDVSDLKTGSWRAKLNWVDSEGKGYYYESPFNL